MGVFVFLTLPLLFRLFHSYCVFILLVVENMLLEERVQRDSVICMFGHGLEDLLFLFVVFLI